MKSKLPYTGLGQTIPMKVSITPNVLEGEDPVEDIVWEGKGDFFEGVKKSSYHTGVNGLDRAHSATVIINGSPFDFPTDGYIRGEITINGFTRNILSFKKRRNPDGSIHHLLFMLE